MNCMRCIEDVMNEVFFLFEDEWGKGGREEWKVGRRKRRRNRMCGRKKRRKKKSYNSIRYTIHYNSC